ncbi:hypothetical protein COO17_08965 [Bacillus wiedmannii]|uniref:N-acetyltransferase domain-containing protein n=1 Tax=Bacillus wiedmannii TaxID=1890302 RepID=A0A2A7BV75_9BACI|nr:hypothetical protein COO17_08965 [Bacillus wiedmannii]
MELDLRRKVLYIFNIAVLPSYRNKGIGSSLLNEAISITNKKDISKIYLEVAESNTIALQLYKKRGFKPIEKMENFYVNTNEHAMEMELIVAKS